MLPIPSPVLRMILNTTTYLRVVMPGLLRVVMPGLLRVVKPRTHMGPTVSHCRKVEAIL
jgi:hypothetical protein